MKRGLLLAFIAIMAVNFGLTAVATPIFRDQFKKLYTDEKKDKDYTTKVTEAKCNVCHYGKSKKNRNDYGDALSKLLDKKKFTKTKIKANPKLEEEMDAAFKKVAEIKNKAGKKFGELIKGGDLPGTEPEEKK